MKELVLIRHGQSIWNLENRFTGWVDVDLSDRGLREARDAGKTMLAKGYRFDVAMTSLLKRSIRTLWLILDEMDQMHLPVKTDWRLNERHYGALQGLDKKKPRSGMAMIRCSSGAAVMPFVPLHSRQMIPNIRRKIPNILASRDCRIPSHWQIPWNG